MEVGAGMDNNERVSHHHDDHQNARPRRGGSHRGRGRGHFRGQHRDRNDWGDRDRNFNDFRQRGNARVNYDRSNRHPRDDNNGTGFEGNRGQNQEGNRRDYHSDAIPPLNEVGTFETDVRRFNGYHAGGVNGRDWRDSQQEGGEGRRGGRGRNNGRGGQRSGNNQLAAFDSHPNFNPNAKPFQPRSNFNGETSEEMGDGQDVRSEDADSNSYGSDRNFNRRRRNNRNNRRPRDNDERSEARFDRSSGLGGEKVTVDSDGRPENFESASTEGTKTIASKGKPKNQREVLIDQLSKNAYDCMVCCEKVRHSQPVWSCKKCFNVFHLACIRKWVSSSVDDSGWRCPGCQSLYESSPDGYYCFCGKLKNPKSSRYDVPHTCGQVCGKSNPGGLNCTHNCTYKCHPGPCPTCEFQQVRYCGCGRTNAQVLCGSKTILNCANICGKALACGAHKCQSVCHPGECKDCEAEVVHECYCGNKQKNMPCTKAANECKTYSCSEPCNRMLSCGKHKCDSICHRGPCSPCKTSPEAVISCPCGQTPVDEACKIARIPKRTNCADPIPTCGKTCNRYLPCGNADEKHRCQKKCHLEKECPPCKLTSNVKCRCGGNVITISCKELRSLPEVTCQKKCKKKRSCGKHKCNGVCCIDIDHICPLVCQRQLSCGNHSCTRLCHLNPCPPCDIVSFEELPCECGASVIYPPVACGTRRPPCRLPCSRQHGCDHPVHHPCHSEPNCPPCTVLTEKWCHGKHELRKNIMCHITEISCGLPCGKRLSCGRHDCPKTCHAGPCLKQGEICRLPCDKLRDCGHQCGAPCHEDECPESKCKLTTEVTCPCGRRSETMICCTREKEYDRTVTWEYHKELKRMEEEAKAKNEPFEITDSLKDKVMDDMKRKIPKSVVLECDKECARLERNRKMAEALQLENVDVTTSVGTPNYSEFLSKFAKKNPQFIEMVHKQLTDLVMKAKQSRKKNETYAFNSMNRDKRHVIHEYCGHFGILSESFDEEPNRNVICFASKEKCYLPSVSLIDAVFRPAVRSERLRPNDDVSFKSEKRTQIVGPSQWNMAGVQKSSSQSKMVALNVPSASASASSDFPPL